MKTLAPSDHRLAADRLAEVAAAHAEMADRGGRLSDDVVDALRDSGLAGMGLPEELGGSASSPLLIVEVLERIGRADAATAWVTMIASTSAIWGAYLPLEGGRRVFAQGSRSLTAGVFAPKGVAVETEGGFRVEGWWPFGSGSLHADWISGGCLVDRGAGPAGPVMTAFFPAERVSILDTWHVGGLRGTGSHDFRVEGEFVPAELTCSLQASGPWSEAPLYAFPPFGMLALGIAGVALGVARGAIDDLLDLAVHKVPTGSKRTLAGRPAVQEAVARSEARLGAARAYLTGEVGAAWQRACDGGAIDVEVRARLRMAATHAVDCAAEVVDAMYRAAGGTSIYDSCPLQQRFRDIHTATQHMMVAQPTWEVAGRVLLGLDTDVSAL
jgi:indole-3-acetate monooxygenase